MNLQLDAVGCGLAAVVEVHHAIAVHVGHGKPHRARLGRSTLDEENAVNRKLSYDENDATIGDTDLDVVRQNSDVFRADGPPTAFFDDQFPRPNRSFDRH